MAAIRRRRSARASSETWMRKGRIAPAVVGAVASVRVESSAVIVASLRDIDSMQTDDGPAALTSSIGVVTLVEDRRSWHRASGAGVASRPPGGDEGRVLVGGVL